MFRKRKLRKLKEKRAYLAKQVEVRTQQIKSLQEFPAGFLDDVANKAAEITVIDMRIAALEEGE